MVNHWRVEDRTERRGGDGDGRQNMPLHIARRNSRYAAKRREGLLTRAGRWGNDGTATDGTNTARQRAAREKSASAVYLATLREASANGSKNKRRPQRHPHGGLRQKRCEPNRRR